MKSYPYVGEGKNRLKYLVLSGGNGFILPCLNYANGKVVTNLNTSPECMKNITREHLEGKCVKIESPEHSVFVQKLAFNNDVLFHIDANYDVIYFYGLNDALDLNDISMWTVITIPLPPKSESETKEWPQIGDKVCYGNGVNCEVTGIHNEVAMIITERGDYHIAYLSELKKPKSEVEILLEDLRAHFEKYTFQDQAINELHLKFNITKKPQ